MTELSQSFQSVYSRTYDPVDRLRWQKSGEGADMSYSVPSSFAKAAKGKSKHGFGSTPRFSATGYEKFGTKEGPGPGAYTTTKSGSQTARGSTSSFRQPVRHNKKDRLDWGPKGEGSDLVYSVQSSFSKAAQKSTVRKTTAAFGSTPRFSRTGYERFDGAPGPGAYSSTKMRNGSEPLKKSTSRPRSAMTHREKERLDWGPKGEGAEFVYDKPSTFDKAASPRKGGHTLGTTERFSATGYEKFKGAPGPGAYSIKRELDDAARIRPKSARPVRERESRVDWGPAGEGAEPVYNVSSSFARALSPGKSRQFGDQERFAPTGYESFSRHTPGPGAYATEKLTSDFKATRASAAPFGTSDRLGQSSSAGFSQSFIGSRSFRDQSY